jgi:aminoglycoside N3'-acetyltransferase
MRLTQAVFRAKSSLTKYPNQLKLKVLRPILESVYSDYKTEDFIASLHGIDIHPGDSVFLMYSQDKIYAKTGKAPPISSVIRDLVDHLGEDGTLMALCFSHNREKITLKEEVFHCTKTPTECGILSEILRRRKGSIRSLHPILSTISYGKKAAEFSDTHHLSPYPFGPTSPYYKLMRDGGKYLGIGVGFEAFTPCHMVEDFFEKEFKHEIYFQEPQDFLMITPDGSTQTASLYVRNPDTFPRDGYDPLYYFKLLNISSNQTFTKSGMRLFSFRMQDFFDAAIEIYREKYVTVWDTGSVWFNIRRKGKRLLRKLLVEMSPNKS